MKEYNFFFFLITGFLKVIAPYTDICAHISVCASVFMVVALTFERHFAICSPHAYRIRLRTTERWKHLFWYIAPVILLAIICNIPLMINLLKVTNLISILMNRADGGISRNTYFISRRT